MYYELNKSIIPDPYKQLKPIISMGSLGLEKESLRVFNSNISQSPHPASLGAPLTNKYITTDFSEAQLEFITPPNKLVNNSTIDFLDNIHHFTTHNLGQEILWPFSMPLPISSDESIKIADYGKSNMGVFKHIYRNGLSHRYGRMMQTISGIHFNYSLPEQIWHSGIFKDNYASSHEHRSDIYLGMSRNILRMNWLLLYLFGASPVLLKNFLGKQDKSAKKLDDQTYYLPYATSLRMSDFGYHNLRRTNINVSYNSLNRYISDLRLATTTPSTDFSKIDEIPHNMKPQINANILQIEDEYYAVIRLKSSLISDERTTTKLLRGGVNFIELRSIDLNPYSRIGIEMETVLFLETFLLFCFFKKSKPLDQNEITTISNNDLNVSKYGRDPSLYLDNDGKKISLKDWGNLLLDEMEPVAELLDNKNKTYSNNITSMRSKINDPNKTMSSRILDSLISDNISFCDLGESLAVANKKYYLGIDSSKNPIWDLLKHEAQKSLGKQLLIEEQKQQSFHTYVAEYFSK